MGLIPNGRHVAALYEAHQHAQEAVDQLLALGTPPETIHVVANALQRETEQGTESKQSSVARNTTLGVTMGGVSGVLLGLLSMTMPEAGAAAPVLAGLTGAGVGAIGGGIYGAMNQLGDPAQADDLYAAAVRRNGVLLLVTPGPVDEEQIVAIATATGALQHATYDRAPSHIQGWEELPSEAHPEVKNPLAPELHANDGPIQHPR